MPDQVVFFADGDEMREPTVIIYEDGSFEEIGAPFAEQKTSRIWLCNGGPGAKRAQLDLAARFASAAIRITPSVTLVFKPGTSPWTYDWMAINFGKAFVDGFAGPPLQDEDIEKVDAPEE
jgi:hypothetical protein